MRTAGSFTRDAASSQSFARRRQVSARSPIRAQTVCVLGPFRLWLWCETLFCHLPKRMFTTYRWGPGEGGVRGERRWGMAGTPRTPLFLFSMGTGCGAVVALMTAGRPRPIKAPLTWGFCFLAIAGFVSPRPTMLAAIGLHTYTDVQWNVTTRGSYRRVVRQPNGYPIPRHPCLSVFNAGRAVPHPPMTPRMSWSPDLSLSSGTPGAIAPRGSTV